MGHTLYSIILGWYYLVTVGRYHKYIILPVNPLVSEWGIEYLEVEISQGQVSPHAVSGCSGYAEIFQDSTTASD